MIAIPTDTVYGLACDPANPAAVERLYAIKQRPEDLELTLLAGSTGQLNELVELTPQARSLASRFWPGGLSIVLPLGSRKLAIPRRGTTLSSRVPDHEVARALLERTGPLASTSANRHGEPPARTAAAVQATLGGEVAVVLDGGAAAGEASTIIDCTTTPPRVLREGPISSDLLFAHLGAKH